MKESGRGTYAERHTICPKNKRERSGRGSEQQDRSCWTKEVATDAHDELIALGPTDNLEVTEEFRVRVHGR